MVRKSKAVATTSGTAVATIPAAPVTIRDTQSLPSWKDFIPARYKVARSHKGDDLITIEAASRVLRMPEYMVISAIANGALLGDIFDGRFMLCSESVMAYDMCHRQIAQSPCERGPLTRDELRDYNMRRSERFARKAADRARRKIEQTRAEAHAERRLLKQALHLVVRYYESASTRDRQRERILEKIPGHGLLMLEKQLRALRKAETVADTRPAPMDAADFVVATPAKTARQGRAA